MARYRMSDGAKRSRYENAPSTGRKTRGGTGTTYQRGTGSQWEHQTLYRSRRGATTSSTPASAGLDAVGRVGEQRGGRAVVAGQRTRGAGRARTAAEQVSE